MYSWATVLAVNEYIFIRMGKIQAFSGRISCKAVWSKKKQQHVIITTRFSATGIHISQTTFSYAVQRYLLAVGVRHFSAHAISHLVTDRNLREEMGMKSREIATANYSTEIIIRWYFEI